MRLVLVKVGGGLLAPKDKRFRLDKKALKAFARQFREVKKVFPNFSFILGNGGGSFGHLPAVEFGFKGKVEGEKLFAAGFIHRKVIELNTYLTAFLQEQGIYCFQFSPASLITAFKGRIEKFNFEPIFQVLNLSIVPLVFGDVVPDRAYNFSIVSTEKILRALALEALRRKYRLERVIYLGKYKGALSSSKKLIEEIKASEIDRLKDNFWDVEGKDITGGMRHKLEEAGFLAGKGVEVNILGFSFKENNLLKVLKGERVGTRIIP